MLAIPKSVLKDLGVGVSDRVDLSISGDALVMRPVRRPKYTLAELLAQGETFGTGPDADWDAAAPVGREII
jgi:antitoxin ChpS